jgi:endonuclease/exonuclease/phosphatase family metal-dependent hydrolase
MTKFVFWNTDRRSVDNLVALLADKYNADLIVLAEYFGEHLSTLDCLNSNARFPFQYAVGLARGLALFCRFSPSFLVPRLDGPRVSIRSLSLPGREELTLVMAHLPSKLFETASDQQFEFQKLSQEIKSIEQQRGHSRTVLIGDLNANPFEAGVVGASGLNATLSRNIARRGSRKVKGTEYPFFYNPMWKHFGEADDQAGGTYYCDTGTHINYYWNVFDQVLVRPDLLPFLPASPVEVISKVGATKLLTASGRPDRQTASDHLPLIFRLDI